MLKISAIKMRFVVNIQLVLKSFDKTRLNKTFCTIIKLKKILILNMKLMLKLEYLDQDFKLDKISLNITLKNFYTINIEVFFNFRFKSVDFSKKKLSKLVNLHFFLILQ